MRQAAPRPKHRSELLDAGPRRVATHAQRARDASAALTPLCAALRRLRHQVVIGRAAPRQPPPGAAAVAAVQCGAAAGAVAARRRVRHPQGALATAHQVPCGSPDAPPLVSRGARLGAGGRAELLRAKALTLATEAQLEARPARGAAARALPRVTHAPLSRARRRRLRPCATRTRRWAPPPPRAPPAPRCRPRRASETAALRSPHGSSSASQRSRGAAARITSRPRCPRCCRSCRSPVCPTRSGRRQCEWW